MDKPAYMMSESSDGRYRVVLGFDTLAQAHAFEDELPRLLARSAPEDGACEGCGSTKSLDDIRAAGHASCCPERKMLSATEWRDRAERAEAALTPQGAMRYELTVNAPLAQYFCQIVAQSMKEAG